MANHLPGTVRAENRDARLAWLQSHPRLYEIPTSYEQAWTKEQTDLLDRLAVAMIKAGLYAPSAMRCRGQVRWGIRCLVAELRPKW